MDMDRKVGYKEREEEMMHVSVDSERTEATNEQVSSATLDIPVPCKPTRKRPSFHKDESNLRELKFNFYHYEKL